MPLHYTCLKSNSFPVDNETTWRHTTMKKIEAMMEKKVSICNCIKILLFFIHFASICIYFDYNKWSMMIIDWFLVILFLNVIIIAVIFLSIILNFFSIFWWIPFFHFISILFRNTFRNYIIFVYDFFFIFNKWYIIIVIINSSNIIFIKRNINSIL